MTRPQLTPPAGVLVAIDVAKARNEVLIEVPGSGRGLIRQRDAIEAAADTLLSESADYKLLRL
jgi:hypothetical protein